MPFNDYSAFRVSITSFMDADELTTAQIDDLIRIGEQKANRDLRVRAMETALSATITSTGTAAVPSDYVELKHAYINQSPILVLERRSAEDVYKRYPLRSAQGDECLIAREGENFIFGPLGNENRLLKGIYYKKPASMSANSTITSVFSAYPDVYLFAALSEAEAFIGRDRRIPTWEAKYQQYKNLANMEEKKEGNSGSPLATRLA